MSYPEPRYLGDTGETSATARAAGAEPELVLPATNVHYLATGASTGGDFGLYRWEMTGPPSGPAPHFHRSITESFYVLSGTVRLYDGKEWTDATGGDYHFVPPGGIHAFRNDSGEPASMLLLFTPGAPREAYFEGLAELAASGRQPTQQEMTEFYRQHDQFMV
jgi:mannose-6-phosphate isomerase-like protein (cupin superfamily)